MTIDLNELKERLRDKADEAGLLSANEFARGHQAASSYAAGRQAGMLFAIEALEEAENDEASERDLNIQDEQLGEAALALGIIGEATLCAVHEAGGCYEGCPDAYSHEAAEAWRRTQVAQLEALAREAGGA